MKIKSILSEILGLTVTTLLEYSWYYHEVLLMALFCAVWLIILHSLQKLIGFLFYTLKFNAETSNKSWFMT